MAVKLSGNPVIKTLLTVASTSTTATSAAFSLPVCDAYTFYMNVTTATAGTCDVVFQTSVDGGTTYVNIPWKFNQIGTSTGCFALNVRTGVGPANDITAPTGTGSLVADTGAFALALQAIIDPRYMKIKYTITTGPDAFVIYMLGWERGSLSGSD